MNQVIRSARTSSGVGSACTRHVGAERLGRLQVPRGIGGRRESEHRRRVEDHRDAVRDQRVIVGIARRADTPSRCPDTGYDMPCGQVHAGIAEADTGVRRRQNHLRARLVVAGIVDGSHEVTARPCAAPGATRCR